MSRRTERVGSTIRTELATIIQRELSDPRLTGMPSITRVKVSPDLAIADVYVTVMGTPGQQTAALNALKHSAGLLRTKLTKAMTLRVAPFLKFHLDEAAKKEIEVLELLRKVAAERDQSENTNGSQSDSDSDSDSDSHSRNESHDDASNESGTESEDEEDKT